MKSHTSHSAVARYRGLVESFLSVDLGFRLCSTPGFMLSPVITGWFNLALAHTK